MSKLKSSKGKNTPQNSSGPVRRSYWAESRDPANAVLFVLPLFVFYQVGILFTGGVRNGVDFITPRLFSAMRFVVSLFVDKPSDGLVMLAYFGLNVIVLLGLLVALRRLSTVGAFRPKIWPMMILESSVYALLFGTTVNLLQSSVGLMDLTGPALAKTVSELGPFSSLVMSVGAGLYEELVFRAIILSGMAWALRRYARVSRVLSFVIAVFFSSLVFSGIHHVGNMADPFSFDVFFFRFFAGVVLAAVYTVRGFGVAVYTHAFYDVIVLVFKA